MDNQTYERFERKKFCDSDRLGQAPLFSFERFCYFLCLFLLIGVAIAGAVLFLIIFYLKPRKPVFSLQALRVNSFALNSTSTSTVYVSSVVLFAFLAENPNKIGIKYSPSEIYFLYGGIPVGVAHVPKFYQPAHSKNVSVQSELVLQNVNLTQMATAMDPVLEFRIAGDIRARFCLLRLTLPVIKVALDCQIDIDYRKILSKGINFTRDHKLTQIKISKGKEPGSQGAREPVKSSKWLCTN
ncbi:NDR1/HIN1-like protein 6 [Aristolochia californica]|uniref:NDR1/HIN1-like protein 6 n=1 Tax=Aristolochia californica TaxID=171875 RepID=UPI0035D6A0A6